MVRRWWLVYGV